MDPMAGMAGMPGQPPMMTNAAQMQSNLAAMMWQMQMASPGQGQMMGGGMMPPWPPAMPQASPMLHVRVEGLKFEYQLTDDDVRKVFARYGEVTTVNVDRDGTQAQIQFELPHQAVAAQHDLDRKQLAGMSGAYLRVEFPPAQYDPNALAQMAAAASAAQHFAAAPTMPGGMPGYPPMMPQGMSGPPHSAGMPGMGGDSPARPKKYTCKLEVGIENDGEFRVGSRMIQVARQIWQDQRFQEFGGKTRLRGKGIGGPHEADEPLALCISCRDQAAFDQAVEFAEMHLKKVHTEFKAFCVQKGRDEPQLQIKVSKKGSTLHGDMAGFPDAMFGGAGGGGEMNRGERPDNAPTDEEIEKLIERRNEARKAANFKEADVVRDQLKECGVVLMDEKGAKGNFRGTEVTKWRFWRP